MEKHSHEKKNTEKPETAERAAVKEKDTAGERTEKNRKAKTQSRLLIPLLAVLVLLAVLLIANRSSAPAAAEPTETLPAVTAEPVETPAEATAAAETAPAFAEDSTEAQYLALLQRQITDLFSAGEDARSAAAALGEAQLAELTDFGTENFTDETLAGLAADYLTAIETEQASLEETYSKADLLWYEGYIKQMQQLQYLRSVYGFMTDSAKLIDWYITPAADAASFYRVYKIVASDIQQQVDSLNYFDYVNDTRYRMTVKNNTVYTWTVTFYFDNYRKKDDEEPLCSSEDTLKNAKPSSSYTVTNRVSSGVSRVGYTEIGWQLESWS